MLALRSIEFNEFNIEFSHEPKLASGSGKFRNSRMEHLACGVRRRRGSRCKFQTSEPKNRNPFDERCTSTERENHFTVLFRGKRCGIPIMCLLFALKCWMRCWTRQLRTFRGRCWARPQLVRSERCFLSLPTCNKMKHHNKLPVVLCWSGGKNSPQTIALSGDKWSPLRDGPPDSASNRNSQQ